jgi:hypothetical protein
MCTQLSKTEIVALYNAIGTVEGQLGSAQSSYRVLASTWLLACLAGIGFILKDLPDPPELPIKPYDVCAGIGIVGALSIILLWVMDICVYQRLLTVNFVAGMKMEGGNPWIPQIRSTIRTDFGGQLPRIVSIYYALMFGLLFTIGFVFLVLEHEWTPLWVFRVTIGAGLVIVALVVLGPWSSGLSREEKKK